MPRAPTSPPAAASGALPALPAGQGQLFLHTCCAPCSGDVLRQLCAAEVPTTLFFYNPNIHPRKEYLLRKEENLRDAERLGMQVVDADYDPERWFALARGMADVPERGARCSMCFSLRLVVTARAGLARGIGLFATVLGISRWKNMAQIDASGRAAQTAVPGSRYWAVNWRKGGGAERMVTCAKRERFYQQQYCGCAYSLRDQNRHRRAQGRLPIVLGATHYGVEAGAGAGAGA